jgi:hypothetical protein
MDKQQFFIEGFGSHDLADALQDLGLSDDVFDAPDTTKSSLAGILAGLDLPFSQVLDGFYPLALSNACNHFGVSGGSKEECIASLAAFVGQPATSS